MSEYNTPIGPIFELQRETIKRTVDVLQFPRGVRNELYRQGADTSEQVGAQILEASRQSIHQSLSVAEAVQHSGEIDDLRETVDQVFDSLLDNHEEIYNTIEERYEETDTETLTRGAEQVNVLLELNRSIEKQLVTTVEEIEERATQSDEVVSEIEAQIDRLADQLERQTERYNKIQSDLQDATDIPVTEPDSDGSVESDNEDGTEPDEEQTREQVDTDEVRCRVCDETYGAITHSHLQTHEMDIEGYKTEFGEDVPL